ncbi:MAG: LicD family protein [Oscillospiraceae bacterium]|nr:LicD family protein [Oscillospiraceae bacterium]
MTATDTVLPGSIRELQLIEVEMLREIDTLCRANNITYYLGEGSLLGAMRHQGFIPWDDDMDLLLLRPEYDRLFALLQAGGLGDRYVIEHHKTLRPYWSAFLRVRLKWDREEFRDPSIAHLTRENGPFIDLMPVDNRPGDEAAAERQSKKIRILRKLLTLKLGVRKADTWQRRLIRLAAPFVPERQIHRSLEKAYRRYAQEETPLVACLASYHSHKMQTVPRSFYGSPRYVPFEGLSMPVPAHAEEILDRVYGNWHQPPPLEEQVPPHLRG